MEDLHLLELRPYGFLLIGLICIFIPVLRKRKTAGLHHTGEKTEGIIFELDSPAGYSHNFKDKVTVRFVTKNKEWITAAIHQESAIYYTGQFKPGKKIDVYYDPQNPSNFYVDNRPSEKKYRLFMFVAGIVFLGIGVYELSGNTI